jgi:hypothetical protein
MEGRTHSSAQEVAEICGLRVLTAKQRKTYDAAPTASARAVTDSSTAPARSSRAHK